MRIGIFGGSFNPPHKMHLQIAKFLLDKDYVDKIFFVPTGSKYKYKNNLVSDKYRLEMLNIMTKNDKRILVSDYELKPHVVYTYETLTYFKEKYPNDEIYFICGVDNLSYMNDWKNGEYILRNYKIIVLDRNTNNLKNVLEKYQEYQKNIIVASIPKSSISSTLIREKLLLNDYKILEKYVKKEVLLYIKDKNLYKK